MYIIVQLYCSDCRKFISLKSCFDDYYSFIRSNYEDYSDYTYLIFDKDLNFIQIID